MNKGTNPKELKKVLQDAVKRQTEGATCSCGEPIWALGSAVAYDSCFMCLTGEIDDSKDYEVI